MTILDAMRHPGLFGRWFSSWSWDPWRVCLAALFGLPLPDGGQALFTDCTGRGAPPRRQVREGWFIVGRRGGKSLVMAFIAVFCAVYRTYRLQPGERGTVMLLAADRAQAGVIFRYISAFFDYVPGLSSRIRERTKETLVLTTGLAIEVHTNSYKAVRGRTVVVCICDEAAFWESEDAASPDTEVINAVRPAMATVPSALLLVVSSAYARRGALYEAFQKHWGRESDDVLVWKAPTWVMNPELPREHPDIARAYADDPTVADAEYGSEFRSDCERPLSMEALQAVTVTGRFEIRPSSLIHYSAFIDASGGSSDSMTLAICHRQLERVVIDAVRERVSPFDPDDVVREFAQVLRGYGLSHARADRYAGEWPVARFQKHGIVYQHADKTKSELYGEFIPLVNRQAVELLDHHRARHQLSVLERRNKRGGRPTIDHPPGGRDDLANAIAGAAVYAEQPPRIQIGVGYYEHLL